MDPSVLDPLINLVPPSARPVVGSVATISVALSFLLAAPLNAKERGHRARGEDVPAWLSIVLVPINLFTGNPDKSWELAKRLAGK